MCVCINIYVYKYLFKFWISLFIIDIIVIYCYCLDFCVMLEIDLPKKKRIIKCMNFSRFEIKRVRGSIFSAVMSLSALV